VHRRRHGHRDVHCTRLNNRQSDRLNDEKIICQLQTTLIKKKCPVLRRAFSSLAFPNEAGTLRERNV
jgi:hypothetical protein